MFSTLANRAFLAEGREATAWNHLWIYIKIITMKMMEKSGYKGHLRAVFLRLHGPLI